MNDEQSPNPNIVHLASGTGYHRVEGNRRASRNGPVSDLPPEIPKVTIRNSFPSLYGFSLIRVRTWRNTSRPQWVGTQTSSMAVSAASQPAGSAVVSNIALPTRKSKPPPPCRLRSAAYVPGSYCVTYTLTYAGVQAHTPLG
jgi:hypothetical protein